MGVLREKTWMVQFLLLGLFSVLSCGTSQQGAQGHARNVALEEPLAQAEAPELPAPRIYREFSLLFTGDLMQHDVNATMADYNDIYSRLENFVRERDLAFVNLEFPVYPGAPAAGYPLFNAHPAYLEAAIRAGFNVYALSNNHSNDKGVVGMLSTLDVLEGLDPGERGLWWSGLRRDPNQDFGLTRIPLGDYTLGFLSTTNVLNGTQGLEHMEFLGYHEWWSDRARPERAQAFLERIRAYRQECDFLVVALHDGGEYAEGPEAARRDFFRQVALAGADVVWGHHPHVLQESEWVEAEGRRALVFYSLGNFYSAQTWRQRPEDSAVPWARTGDGVLWELHLREGPDSLVWGNLEAHWTNVYRHPSQGMVVGFTRDWIDEESLPEAWREYYRVRLERQQALGTPGTWSPPPTAE